MTAQEYFDKHVVFTSGFGEPSIEDQLNKVLYDVVVAMAIEVVDTCEKNGHDDNKYVTDMVKAQNCKWNEFRDIFHKRYCPTPDEEIISKDGFIAFWTSKMPEFAPLLKIEDPVR